MLCWHSAHVSTNTRWYAWHWCYAIWLSLAHIPVHSVNSWKTTVEFLISENWKINQLYPRVFKTICCWKNDWNFQGTVAIFYRYGGQKESFVPKYFTFCISKMLKSVYFWRYGAVLVTQCIYNVAQLKIVGPISDFCTDAYMTVWLPLGWTDLGAIWDMDSGGPKKPCDPTKHFSGGTEQCGQLLPLQ